MALKRKKTNTWQSCKIIFFQGVIIIVVWGLVLLSFQGECCFRQSLHVALTVLELSMNIMLALNSQRLLLPLPLPLWG